MVLSLPGRILDDKEKDLEEMLQPSHREILRSAASCALKRHFFPETCSVEADTYLDSIRAGVFVTLKKRNELRGCIGFIYPPSGLLELVQESAILAATEDPRFLPLGQDELQDISLEITVLEIPHEFRVSGEGDLEKIDIGKDGLMVESMFGKGVLLPQVATEFGFNGREFLEATCAKAGLDRGCWKDHNNRLFIFSALSF